MNLTAKEQITNQRITNALAEYMAYSDESFTQAIDYIWSGDGDQLRSDLGITLVDLDLWEKSRVSTK